MAITNIPRQLDYYNQRQRLKQPGSGPFAPPTGPTGPASPQPAPGPTGPQAPPMAGYVNRQADIRMQPQPAPTPSWRPYRPTPTAPVAGAPASQPQDPKLVQAPQPQPQIQYTPPAAPVAPTIPQAGPLPQAGAPGSTLQDPGQITGAGRAYAARVTQNLQGNNPLVQNAQATEDTAAARRAYSARKGATESLAQTPYSPGSAQYQRVLTETQAGVDAANQAGRNQVNDFTRKTTADAMAAASNLEDQQFGRAIGERTNSQLQAQQLANSIQDPKAKYAFQRAVAAGADPEAAFRAIVGETGTIAEPYRGQSPVETVRQNATDWIKATQPNLVPGSPEFTAAVTARMQEVDQAQRQPLTNSNKETSKEDLREALRSGKPLTPEQTKEAVKTGVIPQATLATVPKGGNVTAWLKDNPSGMVTVEGKVYKVVAGGRTATGAGTFSNQERHTDWVEVVDMETGQTKYIVNPYNNRGPSHGYSKEKAGVYDAPPKKQKGVGDWTPFGF